MGSFRGIKAAFLGDELMASFFDDEIACFFGYLGINKFKVGTETDCLPNLMLAARIGSELGYKAAGFLDIIFLH